MWNHNTVDHSETRIVTYADIWVHKELLRWYVYACNFISLDITCIVKCCHAGLWSMILMKLLVKS